MSNQNATSQSTSASEALEMVTDEDLAIFFHRLGETARLATRAECVEFGELTADARVMRRLRKGPAGPIAKAYAEDFRRG